MNSRICEMVRGLGLAALAAWAIGCDSPEAVHPGSDSPRDGDPREVVAQDAAQPPDVALPAEAPPRAAGSDAAIAAADTSADAAPACLGDSCALAPCSGDPLDRFSRNQIDPPWRDSGGYAPPAEDRLQTMRRSIEAQLAGRAAEAAMLAAEVGYRLCRADKAPGERLVMWRPIAAGTGHGQWIVRLSGQPRRLIVEAPHSFYDVDTLAESVVLFGALGARALITTGTHRCATADASGCSGTTTVCGDDASPFRISDMAHTDRSYFHIAHEVLAGHFADDWVTSLHGFREDGVSVSNGTRQPTFADSPVARVARALAARLPGERVTTCNDYEGADHLARQCATTNTQGRHLNRSEPACTRAAASASERFIHVEQSRAVRAAVDQVVAAFDDVVP